MLDEPSAYAALEDWENYFKEVVSLPPSTAGKQAMLDHCRAMLATKRKEETGVRSDQ